MIKRMAKKKMDILVAVGLGTFRGSNPSSLVKKGVNRQEWTGFWVSVSVKIWSYKPK